MGLPVFSLEENLVGRQHPSFGRDVHYKCDGLHVLGMYSGGAVGFTDDVRVM